MSNIDKHYEFLEARHAKLALMLMLEYAALPHIRGFAINSNLWNYINPDDHIHIDRMVKQQYSIMINKQYALKSNTDPINEHQCAALGAVPHE